MKKTSAVFVFLFIALTFGYSQDVSLDQSINNISLQIKQIKTADAVIDQKIKQIKENVLSFEITKTDNKNKVTSQSFRFNLADINRTEVKQQLDGQVMYVEVKTKDNNRYIEVTKDGKSDGFQSSLKITVYDVDNSRALITAIQNTIDLAEKVELNKFSFSSFDDILAALYQAVKPTPDNANNQKIKSTVDKKDKLDFSNTKDGKTQMYEFNIADINPTKINVNITGFAGLSMSFLPSKTLSISLETNGSQKVIHQFENEVSKSFVSTFSIYPTDIENAKQIKNLLYLAIQNLKSGTTKLSGFSYADQMPAANNSSAPAQDKASENQGKGTPPAPDNTGKTIIYPAPDFDNYPTLYDAQTNTLNAFEKQTANTNSHATGMYSAKSVAYFEKAKSPVRLSINRPFQFIIRLENTTQDPEEIVSLYKLEPNVSHDRREVTLGKASLGSTQTTIKAIHLIIKKIGTGQYLIEADGLSTGEYAIDTKKFDFCFGLD